MEMARDRRGAIPERAVHGGEAQRPDDPEAIEGASSLAQFLGGKTTTARAGERTIRHRHHPLRRYRRLHRAHRALGDAAFREKARALDDALRIAVRDNGGAVIDGKLLGDGILATFPAASQAIAAALACGAAGDAQGLPLHLGLHAGDVIREQNNVYGGAVNIAARISALAAPGEVLVSGTVRGLARTSAGVTFEDRGEHALKGIAEPQRVFAVRKGQARDGTADPLRADSADGTNIAFYAMGEGTPL